MSYYMNVDEIYRVGVEIEKNGKAFYQAAASATKDAALKKLCGELAAWETKHVDLFEGLRRALPAEAREDGSFDPGGEESQYLKATADSHVFVKNKDVLSLVERCTSAAAVLDLAIEFEKDSVVFYSALKQLLPKAPGLDALIDEELRHIGILTAQRARAGA
jgi:rubrerythrin